MVKDKCNICNGDGQYWDDEPSNTGGQRFIDCPKCKLKEKSLDNSVLKTIFEYNNDWYFKFTESHIAELVESSYRWYDRNMGNKVDFDMMRVVMTFILKPKEFNNNLAHSEYTVNAVKSLIPKDTKLKW